MEERAVKNRLMLRLQTETKVRENYPPGRHDMLTSHNFRQMSPERCRQDPLDLEQPRPVRSMVCC